MQFHICVSLSGSQGPSAVGTPVSGGDLTLEKTGLDLGNTNREPSLSECFMLEPRDLMAFLHKSVPHHVSPHQVI